MKHQQVMCSDRKEACVYLQCLLLSPLSVVYLQFLDCFSSVDKQDQYQVETCCGCMAGVQVDGVIRGGVTRNNEFELINH